MTWGRGIACAAFVLAAARPSFSFEEEGRVKIAADALRLAPPALGRPLTRPPPAAAKPFRKSSGVMGRIAGPMGALNDPLWAVPGAGPAADGVKFSAYFKEKMRRFPLVFNGYGAFDLAGGDFPRFAQGINSRYATDRQRLRLAYHPPGSR